MYVYYMFINRIHYIPYITCLRYSFRESELSLNKNKTFKFVYIGTPRNPTNTVISIRSTLLHFYHHSFIRNTKSDVHIYHNCIKFNLFYTEQYEHVYICTHCKLQFRSDSFAPCRCIHVCIHDPVTFLCTYPCQLLCQLLLQKTCLCQFFHITFSHFDGVTDAIMFDFQDLLRNC